MKTLIKSHSHSSNINCKEIQEVIGRNLCHLFGRVYVAYIPKQLGVKAFNNLTEINSKKQGIYRIQLDTFINWARPKTLSDVNGYDAYFVSTQFLRKLRLI